MSWFMICSKYYHDDETTGYVGTSEMHTQL